MLSNFSSFAQQLEKLASQYLGAAHVLTVSSGDVGLVSALAALELPSGAPCYVCDFTFNSTINAALWARLEPVLVDIDRETFNMDPEALRDAMHRQLQRGVVLPTHVFGNPCEVERLEQVAREHESFIIFDAAHAYGSRHAGAAVGTFGDAEVFSLSATKLVTAGEGGLVATPHQWMADRVRYVRGYGFQNDYRSQRVGINGKLSELHAALGTLTVRDVEAQVQRRLEILGAYRSRLDSEVGWQQVRGDDRSTYKDIAVRLGKTRAAVEDALTRDGIQTKRYFVPLHEMKPYARYAQGDPLRRTTELHEECLCVPAFADLTNHDIDRVTRVILDALDVR